jgi:5-oxoprolinase (ATP-hydrolysing)
MPSPLYEEVVEVEERVVTYRADDEMSSSQSWRPDKSSTNEVVLISQELDLEAVRKDLVGLRERGIKSLAVLLLHSYMLASYISYLT